MKILAKIVIIIDIYLFYRKINFYLGLLLSGVKKKCGNVCLKL